VRLLRGTGSGDGDGAGEYEAEFAGDSDEGSTEGLLRLLLWVAVRMWYGMAISVRLRSSASVREENPRNFLGTSCGALLSLVEDDEEVLVPMGKL